MLSLLIKTPNPSTFLFLSSKFLSDNHCKLCCSIGVSSSTFRIIHIKANHILWYPATSSMLIGTPYPNPIRIVIPKIRFLTHLKDFSDSYEKWVCVRCFVVCYNTICLFLFTAYYYAFLTHMHPLSTFLYQQCRIEILTPLVMFLFCILSYNLPPYLSYR